jgi:hypothetical protein
MTQPSRKETKTDQDGKKRDKELSDFDKEVYSQLTKGESDVFSLETENKRVDSHQAGVFYFNLEDIEPMMKEFNRVKESLHNSAEYRDAPEGWSKCTSLDPTKTLDAFPSLHIEEGFTLRAYLFRSSHAGVSETYAMPVGSPFPEPTECGAASSIEEGGATKPPLPPNAYDVMERVKGDGSPVSYLSASLLSREIAEFGAYWHAIRWGTHIILDSESKLEALRKRVPSEAGLEPFRWWEPKPSEWRPTVRIFNVKDRGRDMKETIVSFYTYSPLSREGIYHHVDHYVDYLDDLPFSDRKAHERKIASANVGFRF